MAVVLAVAACSAYGIYGLDDFAGGDPSGGGGGVGDLPVESGPGFAVLRATEVEMLRRPPMVLGRDGGYSAFFEGRSVWLYGDTVFEDATRQVFMISNTWAWSDDLDASDGIRFTFPTTEAGNPAPFFAESPSEAEYNAAHAEPDCRTKPCGHRWSLWPSAIVPDPSRGRALVFYGKIYSWPGLFNFVTLGQSIAVWERFDAPPRRNLSSESSDEPEVMFPAGEPPFGSAAVVDGDTLYVYGCTSDPDNTISKPCRLGRVPLETALDREAWSYFAGDSWTPDIGLASEVLNGNDVMSVGYSSYLDAYLAIYALPLVNDVLIRSAARPEGPWSEPVKAFTARAPMKLWVYDAMAHPELQRDGGRLQYVTYSMNHDERGGEMHLVEVELERSDID